MGISFNQKALYLIGLLILILNKVRRTFIEYSNPRPFSIKNIEKNVAYTLRVATKWHEVAQMYTQDQSPFRGKSILEMGPGPDLGTGIILLSLGAEIYHAIDMFPLAKHTPELFYDALFQRISNFPMVEQAKKILSEYQLKGWHKRFNYKIVSFPSLRELNNNKYDIILSQAVWEHISNPEATLFSLLKHAGENALFLNEVDMASHTRIIREIDPLNILRYEERIYKALAFPGTPNRWRSSDYLNLSNKAGLKDIKLIPTWRCSDEYVKKVSPHLAMPFKDRDADDLAILSCFWLAKFP